MGYSKIKLQIFSYLGLEEFRKVFLVVAEVVESVSAVLPRVGVVGVCDVGDGAVLAEVDVKQLGG